MQEGYGVRGSLHVIVGLLGVREGHLHSVHCSIERFGRTLHQQVVTAVPNNTEPRETAQSNGTIAARNHAQLHLRQNTDRESGQAREAGRRAVRTGRGLVLGQAQRNRIQVAPPPDTLLWSTATAAPRLGRSVVQPPLS